MTKLMKAAVVHAFGEPMTIEEIPVPAPGRGQVLVRVVASGVCHTDIHAADGDWPVRPALPFVPGHEGAELTINAALQDPVCEIQKQIGGEQGVVVTAVSNPAFRQGIGMLRRGGTCALIGLPPGDFPVSLFDIVLNRYTIRGSIVGTRHDFNEALQFAGDGKVRAIVETQPLAAINDVFARLKSGVVTGWVVLDRDC